MPKTLGKPGPPGNQQPKAQKKSKRQRKPKNPNNQNRQVTAPVSYGSVAKVGGPKFKASKNGSVCVSHNELIGDVNGSVGYAVTSYPINAGLSSMFAWLSAIAPNYESYKFKRLHFKFVPACSTTTSGVLYLTVEFDPQDAVPTSERQIAAYDGATTGSVWARHTYNCAARNLNKRASYFVRNGTIPSTDLPLYDVGYLILSTSGNPNTDLLGKLWVEYDVELTTPQLNNLALGNSLSIFVTGTDKAVTVPTTTGNAPLTASVAGGLLFLTASSPYQAFLGYNIAGTGLNNPTVGGTATVSPKAVVLNAAGTVSVGQYTATFNEGDTLSFDLSVATTITGYFIRFGQYNVSFG